MGPLYLLNHVLNLFAPALVVGSLVAYLAPIFSRNMVAARTVHVQAAINSVAGALAMVLGLWFFGRDGKMASYAAMVVFVASSQYIAARAWR